MIEVVSAEDAYTEVAKGRVLLCFASEEHLSTVQRVLHRYHSTLGIRILRVEPSEAAAEELQTILTPSFTLFEDGNERFAAVGADDLMQKLESNIR